MDDAVQLVLAFDAGDPIANQEMQTLRRKFSKHLCD
jgi:hypothetical protein